MHKIITTHLSSKHQVTIPKEAREILGIHDGSEPLGFVIDSKTRIVKLMRVNIVPSDEDFSDDEYHKLIHMANNHVSKICKTANEAIRFHKKLTKK